MSVAVACTTLTGEDGLEVREQPDRPLEAGEVRIAVRAASVNYPAVTEVYPLAQGVEAVRAVRERRAAGKVVIEMPDET